MLSIKPLELPTIPAGGGMISEVSVQKKDLDRCSIYLDGKFAFGIHMNVVVEARLKKGVELTENDCLDLVQKDLYHKAFKRCMDYIAYRPRSLHEIRTRLSDLKVTGDVAERIEARLKDLGYINDEEFARQWVESRVRSKGYGPMRLQNELRKKGIASDLAKKAVDEACPAEVVESQLEQQMNQALKRYRNERDDQKKRQKIVGFLNRRGFAIGPILSELDRRISG